MPLLELENATFSYPNGVLAVDDVSFAIEPGESVAIIGQNGAGKTTTVKMINGLFRPTSGTVSVSGIKTTDRTAAQTARDVGYVFQNPDDQIFNNTVFAEIEYALKRFKVGVDEARDKVQSAAELCGIQDELETNPYDLPLSIRKFITIASVLAVDTKVVILDEPTAGQDLVGLRRIADIISHLQREGKTIITITHDMEFVAEHFKRIIVMANRKVVADGDSSRIFEDAGVMSRARLRQPVLAQAYSRLGFSDAEMTLGDLMSRLRQ